MNRLRIFLFWIALAAALTIPVAMAAMSPLLAWRGPAYIAAGFAGVLAMALLLVQPLLAGNYLPGLSRLRAKQIHRFLGVVLLLAVIIHVAGLWITSPPDVIDALLFRSPTPFSAWGVIGMLALFAAALFALLRKKLRMNFRHWKAIHLGLAAFTATTSVVHALLIEGTMETVSKAALCILVVAAVGKLVINQRIWELKRK